MLSNTCLRLARSRLSMKRRSEKHKRSEKKKGSKCVKQRLHYRKKMREKLLQVQSKKLNQQAAADGSATSGSEQGDDIKETDDGNAKYFMLDKPLSGRALNRRTPNGRSPRLPSPRTMLAGPALRTLPSRSRRRRWWGLLSSLVNAGIFGPPLTPLLAEPTPEVEENHPWKVLISNYTPGGATSDEETGEGKRRRGKKRK